MDCSSAREALSALLDGELAGPHRAAFDAHLADCPECRRWRDRAHEVTRRFRLASAEARPSPGESLLVAARAAAPRGGLRSPVTITRAALVAIGVGQLIVTVPALLLGSDHDAPMHVAHEMGSFGMALAVGFFAAALRPARARGMSLVIGAAALLLVATALIDLAAGRTTPADEAPHLLAVAGWLFLRRLTALTPSRGDEHAAPVPTPMESPILHASTMELREEGTESEASGYAAGPGQARTAAIGAAPHAPEADPDRQRGTALAG